MFTTHEELCEMFNLPPEGASPQERCIEGVECVGGWFPAPWSFKKGNKVSIGNKGNIHASAPAENKNNIKQYWFKTPTEEGTCFGKKTLVEKGFPPSIQAKRNEHYVGGTSFRNMKWAGYEYKNTP